MIIHIAATLLLLSLAGACCSERLKTVNYEISTDKVSSPLRILHISDLHSSRYGKAQNKLKKAVDALCPQAIMLTGDIADNRVDNGNTVEFMRHIGSKYPCFYVEGNHEVYTGDAEGIKNTFRSFGITVLEGSKKDIVLNGQKIAVCGVDDPYGSPDNKERLWEDQLRLCDSALDKGVYSILLTHRPELIDLYLQTDHDLFLAGHAHGGQIIIPRLINGIYAPHQGFFPRYAGGRFDFGRQTMIVSRGLSKYVRPRVFNRPELVMISIIPE